MPDSYNAAVDFVDRAIAEGWGARTAFIDPDRRVTYAELADAVGRVGPALARLGVEPENRIALVLHDTVDFPVMFWGAIRAGVVPVLLNTLLNADQYRYLLRDSRAKVAFVSEALLPIVREAGVGVATLGRIVAVGGRKGAEPQLADLLAAEREPGQPAATRRDDVAYWQYSSGTTGNPKGVMHPHTTSMATARLVGQKLMGLTADDVIFSPPKLFFAYGLNNSITCPMSVGASAVLSPDRPTSQGVFAMMRRHKPTVFYGVPTLYAMILADAECQRGEATRRLRACFSAGEPLPAHIGRAWKERFGLDIVNGIGSTELAHLFMTNLPDAVEYGTSGVPVKGYEVRLCDERGHDIEGAGMGELLVKGPTMAIGYWNQAEKTRATFQGPWLKTGDKYERRADGVFIFHGRTDDMFKAGGIWVSPFEVEAALITHPRILEAAVVPTEDADGLLKPRAFVVLKQPCAPSAWPALVEELKDHVRAAIGPWKYPRWIEAMDTLPKTATGKIQRYILRKDAAAGGKG